MAENSNGAMTELFNCRIADVINGRYFDPGTRLLLADGTIKAVIRPGESGPLNSKKIDLGGRTVIPGLINPHVHVQLTLPTYLTGIPDLKPIKKLHDAQVEKNLSDCIERGITTVSDALSENLLPNRILKKRIAEGEIRGPRIIQGVLVAPLGGAMSKKKGIAEKILYRMAGMTVTDFDDKNCGVVVFPPESAKEIVIESVKKAVEIGAEFIKLYDQHEALPYYKPGSKMMTQEQMNAASETARSHGLPISLHHLRVESLERAMTAGIDSLAHVPYDEILRRETADKFSRSGIVLIPTLSLAYYLSFGHEGHAAKGGRFVERLSEIRNGKYESLIDEYWLPELAKIAKRGMKNSIAGKFRIMGVMDLSAAYKYYSGIINTGAENLLMLYESGVEITCANDGGAAPCTPAMVGLEMELLDAVLNGGGCSRKFTGAEALRAATINGARALKIENRFGSIETGKVADLAVVDGDPINDLSVIGKPVAALFIGGKMVVG